MERLGCERLTSHTAESPTKASAFRAPPYRWDLKIEMDFVEEYARLNGYDKIPEALPPYSTRPPITTIPTKLKEP